MRVRPDWLTASFSTSPPRPHNEWPVSLFIIIVARLSIYLLPQGTIGKLSLAQIPLATYDLQEPGLAMTLVVRRVTLIGP